MPSIPLLSIPIYYLLAAVPHGYAVFGPGAAAFKSRDNSNPHGTSNQTLLKKHLSPRDYAAYERAERCHANALENMPLFVAANFAGLLAEKAGGKGSVGVDAYAVGFLVVRALHTVFYLRIESHAWSNLRTMAYLIGVVWSFVVIARAAIVLA
jgi:uncharacterized MAPEG superfamily protein